MSAEVSRTIGLAGATGLGVGAIVGGGILALAGVAFAATGPGAIAAFALNGVVAFMTVLSVAELSSRFPESGGTYNFARKVLSVEAAFAVGWVVWFASLVAAALYAAGFAAFGILVLENVWRGLEGTAPGWLGHRAVTAGLACAATVVLAMAQVRLGGGGAVWLNVGKVLVFAVLVAGGLWALVGSPPGTVGRTLHPFLPHGTLGLIQAMGFTFIALQGFDLIAAVAGEVRQPARTIPRAMLLSLGIALAIYLPLLLVIATVGVAPGVSIGEASAANPETIVAVAAGRFLGPFGYWLVVVAAVLAMLSALQANLFAASRIAHAMARHRTLPAVLESVRGERRTPVNAVVAVALIVVALLALLPDVAAAGAAASLVFLATFALAHVINVLARRRAGPEAEVFRTPLFPIVPLAGGLACVALALFQAFAVPAAGRIAAVWLGIGGVLFVTLFARPARVRDAASEAAEPNLIRLRGRSPLVLVPVANPAHAPAMVEVASAMVAPGVGRVLLLNVVDLDRSEEQRERALAEAQRVLGEALLRSFTAGLAPEALTTAARGVWREIARVARTHDCESLLLGLSDLDTLAPGGPLEWLMERAGRDAVVLRSPPEWRLSEVRRILVAVGGRGGHDVLRARLVASLRRGTEREITYLRVVLPGTTDERRDRVRRAVTRLARDEVRGRATVEVVESRSVTETVARRAPEHDLVILGVQRHGRRRRVFGDLATRIARETACAIVLISRGG